MKELTYIGKSYPVQDAAAKATGELLYVDDMTMPRMLYAKALFSPVAHARIKRIDTTAAEALPGVWAVATYQNTPQTRFNSTTRFYMQAPAPIETERIFDDTVRFVGDRVAAVAAETEDIAQAAIDLIEVEYEPLPVVTDPLEAMREDAYPLHGSSNIALRMISTGFNGCTKRDSVGFSARFCKADSVFIRFSSWEEKFVWACCKSLVSCSSSASILERDSSLF